MFDEQVCLFDSIRRTKVRARVIRSNKNLISFDSLEREEYVQSCSNLELNTRARVQLNSMTILVFSMIRGFLKTIQIRYKQIVRFIQMNDEQIIINIDDKTHSNIT